MIRYDGKIVQSTDSQLSLVYSDDIGYFPGSTFVLSTYLLLFSNENLSYYFLSQNLLNFSIDHHWPVVNGRITQKFGKTIRYLGQWNELGQRDYFIITTEWFPICMCYGSTFAIIIWFSKSVILRLHHCAPIARIHTLLNLFLKTAKLKYHECKISLLKGTMLIETSYSEFSLGGYLKPLKSETCDVTSFANGRIVAHVGRHSFSVKSMCVSSSSVSPIKCPFSWRYLLISFLEHETYIQFRCSFLNAFVK